MELNFAFVAAVIGLVLLAIADPVVRLFQHPRFLLFFRRRPTHGPLQDQGLVAIWRILQDRTLATGTVRVSDRQTVMIE